MWILVACEESQAVANEFRKLGHRAYSCDTKPCSGGHPSWHIQEDVKSVLAMKNIHNLAAFWDMIIAFPPCTHLCSSGARWWKEKQADGRQQDAIDFFMQFVNHDCPKIAIENPIGIMSTKFRRPDQIIQPWQYGHGETKATCLWTKGLPLLRPTDVVPGRLNRIASLSPSEDRSAIRSKTYLGIAKAMAEQWGVNG